MNAERTGREQAETKLEEVEFELAEAQAGGDGGASAMKTADEEDDDSNNEYLLGEIEDLKV